MLPNEFIIQNKNIKIEYKVIRNLNHNNPCIMAIITDKSNEIILQDEIQNDRNKLAMIVNAVINKNELINSIIEFNEFCISIFDKIIYENCDIYKGIITLYRTLHNFKGIFSQFGLINTTKHLHEIETELYNNKNSSKIQDYNNIKEYIYKKNIQSFIDEDILVIKSILGDDFFLSQETYQITAKGIDKLKEDILTTVSPSRHPAIINMFSEIQRSSIKKILLPYCNYTYQLAGQLGKYIKPVEIKGEDFKIDKSIYRMFLKSLINVFRNMVYHGIELPDERVNIGKSEIGLVECKVSKNDKEIIIEISDDGKGIDIEKLQNIAIKKGLVSENQMKTLNQEKILNLIFEDGITVCSDANMIAGRGEGMAHVKNELNKINGSVKIETKKNIGTSFIFTLPLNYKSLDINIKGKDIINELIIDCTTLIKGNNITGINETKIIENKEPILHLGKYNSIIEIRGAYCGFISICINDEVANLIRKYYLKDCFINNEIKTQECVQEFCNTIVGNIFEKISCGECIIIDKAFSILGENTKFLYSDSEVQSGVISTDLGDINIMLFSKNF